MSHEVKTLQWTIDAFHRPFEVSCGSVQVLNKYHYVFAIPQRVMRHRATSFNHFRTSQEGKKFKICFNFFLDFMEAMISASEKKSPQAKGKNTLGFIEWCPSTDSKTELETAGWRLHVFVDRGMSEMFILENFIAKLQKETEKLESKGKHIPSHYYVNTMASYGAQVYSTYSGQVGNFEQLYQNLSTGCAVSPSALFELKEMDDSIYPLESYTNSSRSFVFPSSNFIRVDTEKISFKKFATRRLPDHVMFSLAKPEARIFRNDRLRVEFSPHRYFKSFDVNWTEDSLQEFVEEFKDKYIIYEEGYTREVFNIGEVTYSKPLHSGDVWLENRDVNEMMGEAAVAYEKMRANQHDISTIDHITLSAIGREDKNKFIEEEFLTHVFNDEDCFASTPLKSVIRWLHKEYDPSLIKPFKLVHDKVSVLGHRACIIMHMYHHLYQVSSAHRACYWIHISRLDAFRHQHNLHLNAVWTGDAATSKSYGLAMMEKNSISGTVSNRTYDTDKADAIDSDKNHCVHMFDEAPPGFFKDPKKKGPLEALKMKLTSMKTTHRRLFTNDETGIREQIESTSSNIGCLMGATNESRSSFDRALITRFHFFEAEKALNTKHSVANCQHAAETMGKAQKEKLKAAVMFHKFEQAYAALMWTYIRMGRIQEPDTSAVGIITKRFTDILKRNYDVEVESRTIERVKRLSQNLAIVRAKQILYHTETGKYANVPFHPRQLPDAEQYLICTEEIVIHAIGLEFDGIVSRNRRKVLNKIWQMHIENEVYKQDDKGEDDVNYLELNGNLSSISKRLLNALMEDHVHVSVCNILTVFVEIRDQTLCCEGYTNAEDNFHDGLPGNDNIKKRWAAMEEYGGKTYLHLELFRDIRESGETNMYKSVVEKLMHEYTAEKRIVLGMNSFTTNEPNIWDTIQFKPRNGHIIQMTQGIGEVDDPYDVLGETMDLDEELEEDLDVYVARAHEANVGYKITPYMPNPEDWADNRVAYPFRKSKRKH